MTASLCTIDKALVDEALLGAALEGNIAPWRTWRIALKGAFGLPLSDDERKIFSAIAGGRNPPAKRVRELWCVIGRRGGKSKIAAALATYHALFVPHKLSRGEKGLVLVLAASRDQAQVVFDYVRGFLEASPVLAQEILDITRTEIRLRNGIVIAVRSNSFRTIRGRTLLCCIFDEVGFWRDETSAVPDREVYTAVLPTMMTTGGMLISISTPYRKLGLLHQKWRDHYAQDDPDVLVVQGASSTFNPLLTPEVIAAQRAADPEGALAELDADFRIDVSSFLDDSLIDRAIDHGRPLELPPVSTRRYSAFTDASGGRRDHYTVAIGHKDGERYVVDLVRGAAPHFDPMETTKQYAALLSAYGIQRVTGDNFAQEWVAGAWRSCGINYEQSKLVRSDIYLECLPTFTRGLVSLPDHARLLRELRLLERHTHRSGRDTVDHGKHGSDDYCNSVCGTLQMLASGPLYSPLDMYFRAVDGHEAWLKWKAEQQQEQQRQYMAGVR
jgi:Terminase large subunit, ATPase domain